MDISIDAAEVTAFATRMAGYPARAQAEWHTAGTASGQAIQRLAQSRIQVDTGAAKAQTTMESVSSSPAGVTVIVSSRATSGRGFPYPIVLNTGRTKGRRGGAYPGNRFFDSSIEDAGPFIDNAFGQAADRLLAWAAG